MNDDAIKRLREAIADQAFNEPAANVDDVFRAMDDWQALCSPDNIAALLDDNDRLRKDAERIDWLTTNVQMGSKLSAGYVLIIEVPISHAHFLACSNDDLRAAIDAAMSSASPPECTPARPAT